MHSTQYCVSSCVAHAATYYVTACYCELIVMQVSVVCFLRAVVTSVGKIYWNTTRLLFCMHTKRAAGCAYDCLHSRLCFATCVQRYLLYCSTSTVQSN
jgi:hypothetical protein